ncbi:MAG: alpha/beta hydrolase [Chryseolinea sp.]
MKATINDTSVFYNVEGTGEVTLLFIHGSYIDQTYWNKQVQYFASSYKVVAVDLPGHGKSGQTRQHWSITSFADDIVALMELLHLRQVILIGHSMGAEIGLIVATKTDKLAGFISVDYFKNAATELPKEMVAATLKALAEDYEGTNEQFARTGLLTERTPKIIADRVVQDYRNSFKPMGMAIMPEMLNLAIVERTLLPRLTMKLYLVVVDYSPTNEQPLKDYVKYGYEITKLSGTCHFPMLESPEELNRVLGNIINVIESGLVPKIV